ncbi:MAG: hypothetical protein WC442_02025 [Candidatus Omnitrophota bacterium]
MSIFKKIFTILLIVIISFYAFYFLVVYSDLVLSGLAKKKLNGKIIYSQLFYIKEIGLPSGKIKTLYTAPRDSERYLASVLNPSFSPDGKKIVFSRAGDPRINHRDRLWIMDSDGTNLKEIFGVYDQYLLSPSFSPDGKKIAFVLRNSQQGGRGGLYSLEVDTPNVIDLISNILPGPAQLSWTPDSKGILFSSEELFSKSLGPGIRAEVDRGGIYIVNINDKSYRKVVEIANQPSLSPDGKRLAYEGEKGYYLGELTSDGYLYNSQLIIPYKKLFIGYGGSFPIRWSPDGKYLVYAKEIWPGKAGLYVVEADNPKKKIRIGTDYTPILGISWAKDN